MTLDMRSVDVMTANGTWHKATQNLETGVLYTPEGCNLDDAERLQLYPDLPDGVLAIDLCKRCHPTVTERWVTGHRGRKRLISSPFLSGIAECFSVLKAFEVQP